MTTIRPAGKPKVIPPPVQRLLGLMLGFTRGVIGNFVAFIMGANGGHDVGSI
jgi:hypothetical protein